jgi:hypothetical protein
VTRTIRPHPDLNAPDASLNHAPRTVNQTLRRTVLTLVTSRSTPIEIGGPEVAIAFVKRRAEIRTCAR